MKLKLNKYVLKQYQADKGFDAFPWALWCLYPHYSPNKIGLTPQACSTHNRHVYTVVRPVVGGNFIDGIGFLLWTSNYMDIYEYHPIAYIQYSWMLI